MTAGNIIKAAWLLVFFLFPLTDSLRQNSEIFVDT